jgi:hypothetical protein
MRGKTHSREASYSGFYTPSRVFKAERPKQAHAQGNNTHSRNTQSYCKQYPEHTWQSTNNCKNHTRYFKYQRCLILALVGGSSYETIELILFILGSWLVLAVDSFIFWLLASGET